MIPLEKEKVTYFKVVFFGRFSLPKISFPELLSISCYWLKSVVSLGLSSVSSIFFFLEILSGQAVTLVRQLYYVFRYGIIMWW